MVSNECLVINIDKDYLYENYIVEQKSMRKLAKELKCCRSTIRNRLLLYDIPIRNISESMKGRNHTQETKKRISKSGMGRKHTKETKRRISESQKGKKLSEEHRRRISEGLKGKKLPENVKRKISEALKGKNNPRYNKTHTEETKNKMSVARLGRYCGVNHPNWKGGFSFEPYCEKFNYELKEEIRNRDNRVCQTPDCGKSEILNGERLSVHHIDGNKMQGCDGKVWYLVALCRSCNIKKDTVEKEFLIVSNMECNKF